MTYDSRRQTGAAEAALILRDLKDRVDRLEKEQRGSSDSVQLFRNTRDIVTCSDSHTVTVNNAAGFVFSESEWGFDEFGETQ